MGFLRNIYIYLKTGYYAISTDGQHHIPGEPIYYCLNDRCQWYECETPTILDRCNKCGRRCSRMTPHGEYIHPDDTTTEYRRYGYD